MPRSSRSCSSSGTCGWRATSEVRFQPLIDSLRHQPLLLVLRPRDPWTVAPLLERLRDLGLLHVEIAWRPGADWVAQCLRLVEAFPGLALGAASLCSVESLEASREAGLGYGVSPVLERALLRRAAAMGLPLVPGVFSPTEVHRARRWGCPIVKLFPAATLGPQYWARLRAPLGDPLPFCLAAGGLGPEDVLPWLAGGVDAVALGSALLDPGPPSPGMQGGQPDPGSGLSGRRNPEGIDPEPLRRLLHRLRSDRGASPGGGSNSSAGCSGRDQSGCGQPG